MVSRCLIVVMVVALVCLHNTSALQSHSNVLKCRAFRSNRVSLSPAFNEVSQIISTSISSATIEVASNEVIAKQIFEPQISTETGIGDTMTQCLLPTTMTAVVHISFLMITDLRCPQHKQISHRIVGFLAITALITVTGGYWWNIIIPAKRTELALSKRKGANPTNFFRTISKNLTV